VAQATKEFTMWRSVNLTETSSVVVHTVQTCVPLWSSSSSIKRFSTRQMRRTQKSCKLSIFRCCLRQYYILIRKVSIEVKEWTTQHRAGRLSWAEWLVIYRDDL